MAISDKILYLNDTKKLLKQEINKSTEITDEDTFRSYAPKIYDGYLDLLNNGTDTLWNNLEKVSASEEETPVLENVETAPIKMVLNGNTSQEIIPKDVGKEVIDTNIAITDVDIEKESYIELQGNTSQKIIPKDAGKEVTDTNIVITDVDIEKESYIELNGNTSQDTTSGKNLIKIVGISNEEEKTKTINGVTFTVNEDGTVKVEGTNNSTSRILQAVTYESAVTGEAGTYYYFANSPSQPKRLEMACFVDEKYEYPNSYGTTPWSKTATTNFTIRNIYFVIDAGETVNNVYYVILTKDVNPQPYEPFTGGQPSPSPDYPQEVKAVTGENVVSVQSKNMANFSILGKVPSVSNGELVNYGGAGCTELIEIDNTKEYVYTYETTSTPLGRYVFFYDENGNYINNRANTASGYKPSSESWFSQTKYLRLRLDKMTVHKDIQLEEGSTATPYVPYSKTDYPINLGNIELCKIGDYKDYLYKNNGKWYVHKEIGKYQITGQESSSVFYWANEVRGMRLILDDAIKTTANAPLYCNRFKLVQSASTDANYVRLNRTTGVNYTGVWFGNISITGVSDVTTFKTYAMSNDIILYYPLATPTETEITDTSLIAQLDNLHTAQLQETSYISSTPTKEYPYINLKYNVITPAPSPERPSEINKVTGNNVVSVSGKNLQEMLFTDGSSNGIEWHIESDGSIIINGTTTSSVAIRYTRSNLMPVVEGKTYTLSATGMENIGNFGYKNSGTGKDIAVVTTSSPSLTFEATSNMIAQANRLDLYIRADKTFVNQKVTLQLEEGSTASEYTPFSKTDYPIDLIAKNLFDKDNANILIALIDASTKVITTAAGYRTIWVEAESNKTYKVKKIADTSSNGRFRVGTSIDVPAPGGSLTQAIQDDTAEEITITTGATDKYIAVFCYKNKNSTITLDEILSSLEIRETSAIYEELCKIGDYKDYFHKDSGKWYVHKEIGKDKLSSLNVVYHGVSNNIYQYELLPTNIPIQSEAILSTHFSHKTSTSAGWWTFDNNIVINTVSGDIHIYMTTSQYANITEFNNFTSSNDVYIYYPIATPIETEITNTTLIEQLEALYTAKLVNSTAYISTIADNLEPFIDLNYNVVIPSPSPEKPSEVKVVKGENVVSVSGKNLFNILEIPTQTKNGVTFTNNGNGTFNLTGTATTATEFSFVMPLSETKLVGGKQYTMSTNREGLRAYVHSCTSSGTWKTTLGYVAGGTSRTFNLAEPTTNYIKFSISILSGASVNYENAEIQLEEGSTASEYTPFSKTDYPLSLGTLELCKIGDYQDYLYKNNGKWYKHKVITKRTLNFTRTEIISSRTWFWFNKPSNSIDYGNFTTNAITEVAQSLSNISSKDIAFTGNGAKAFYGISYKNTYENIPTLTELQEKVNGKSYYYVLATPTEEEITNSTLIEQLEAISKAKSVKDKTYITQTNDELPFILDVEAIKEYEENLDNN